MVNYDLRIFSPISC